MNVPYPLAGTTNSAVRAGVVDDEAAARVRWMQLPGDPREHYIARLQWADARTLLVQQLNRLQNTVSYLLAEAATGVGARDVARPRRGVHHHRLRRAARGACRSPAAPSSS